MDINELDLPEQEKERFAKGFVEFLSALKSLATQLELDYRKAADEPDFEEMRISLSFGFEDEPKVDALIRDIRGNLASNYVGHYLDHISGKYPLAVWKLHTMTPYGWTVEFYFATDWQVLEDTQPSIT
ncbi:hypothetical protein [Vibrio sp. 10N.247.311.51]|uniref:hypothetical protein n=1 Tax=Vibrio sp. 10N.247.311.51 TaxID=3229996 RepID=UPI0035518C66